MRDTMEIKIAPSIISADFSKLSEDVQKVEKAGADLLHVDVYPLLVWGFEYKKLSNITIGLLLIEALRNRTKLPFDVHLAIEASEEAVMRYIDAGSDIITVQVEACPNPQRFIRLVRKEGLKVGLAVSPFTPMSYVFPHIQDLDVVLFLTVSLNFGGQNFFSDIISKIKKARSLSEEQGLSLDIGVDGGMNSILAPQAVAAGANVIVAGSAVFGRDDYQSAIKELRDSCIKACRSTGF